MPGFLQSTQATQPTLTATTFLPADTTVAKSILGNQGQPFHVFDILVTSDDTAAQTINIFSRSGSTNSLLGSIALVAGVGTLGVAPASFVQVALPANLVGLDFQGTLQLQAAMVATITAGKTVTVSVLSGQY